MKRIIHSVNLLFFQDDANGEWGLANKKTISSDDSFNAFWNGRGIFHDVWEHYFEHTHKYFCGNNSMNVAGEMAAMGHMHYYYETLGVHNRPFNNNYHLPDSMRKESFNYIQEAIASGWCNYGYTLNTGMPRQRRTDNEELEYQISKEWEETKQLTFTGDDQDSREYSQAYKASVTLGKIQNAHRWGYRQASRMVPDNYENRARLIDFIDFWNDYTKSNAAGEMSGLYSGIDFTLYKDNGVVSWKAVVKSASSEFEDEVIATK